MWVCTCKCFSPPARRHAQRTMAPRPVPLLELCRLAAVMPASRRGGEPRSRLASAPARGPNRAACMPPKKKGPRWSHPGGARQARGATKVEVACAVPASQRTVHIDMTALPLKPDGMQCSAGLLAQLRSLQPSQCPVKAVFPYNTSVTRPTPRIGYIGC